MVATKEKRKGEANLFCDYQEKEGLEVFHKFSIVIDWKLFSFIQFILSFTSTNPNFYEKDTYINPTYLVIISA